MSDIGKKFEELVEIVDRLRAPDGCPWDREQTNQSLLPYFIEEAYELIESVDEENWDTVKEELGDLLFQVIFHAQINDEEKNFDIFDVINDLCKKMIRRHPHIFSSHNHKNLTMFRIIRHENPKDLLELGFVYLETP